MAYMRKNRKVCLSQEEWKRNIGHEAATEHTYEGNQILLYLGTRWQGKKWS